VAASGARDQLWNLPVWVPIQSTVGSQLPTSALVKLLPSLRPSNQPPVCASRAMTSSLPSLLKSRCRTSLKVRVVEKLPNSWLMNALPLDFPTPQLPLAWSRSTRSSRPSPLTSATYTSPQVMLDEKLPQSWLTKWPLGPTLSPTQRLPVSAACPT